MASKPETRLVHKMREKLEARGAWTMKVHGGPMQTSGIPDILACYRGLFVAIEAKMPGQADNLSPRQQFVQEQIQSAKGCVCTLTSVEGVEALLDWIDRTAVIER